MRKGSIHHQHELVSFTDIESGLMWW